MTKEELYNMQQLLNNKLIKINGYLKKNEPFMNECMSGNIPEHYFEEEKINQCIYTYLLVKIQEDLERIENR